MMNTLTAKKGFWGTLWEYLTTTDHKKVAHLYFFAAGFFFVLGGDRKSVV